MLVKLTKEEEITKQSYEKIAARWANAHQYSRYWDNEIKKFHELLPKGTLLEIGCGSGRDAKKLISLGYDYFGTDLSTNLLTEARKANPKASFQETSLYNLDFTSKFDGFWCAAVLLHVPKKRINEALSAIKRNLKPDAVGFIAVKEGKGEKMETFNYKKTEQRFFAYWDLSEFRKVLLLNKFKILHDERKTKSDGTTWLTYHVQKTD